MSRGIRALSWLIALLGLWEFGDVAAAFVPGFGAPPAFLWSHILAGGLLVIAGVRAATAKQSGTARPMHWMALVAGTWLVVGALAFGSRVPAAGVLNDIAVGVIAAGVALACSLRPRRDA